MSKARGSHFIYNTVGCFRRRARCSAASAALCRYIWGFPLSWSLSCSSIWYCWAGPWADTALEDTRLASVKVSVLQYLIGYLIFLSRKSCFQPRNLLPLTVNEDIMHYLCLQMTTSDLTFPFDLSQVIPGQWLTPYTPKWIIWRF